MSSTILLGYAGGIITMACLAMDPKTFKPTITENPLAYIIVGLVIGIAAAFVDNCWWCI